MGGRTICPMEHKQSEVQPIQDDSVAAVAAFLHEHLNRRVTMSAWLSLLRPPWQFDAPNHGFQLVTDSGIVGVYVAVYSERDIACESRRFCNLAAFCVLNEFRVDSLRLIRAILRQPGLEFTDLSSSGNVVALNERLGFVRLDTSTRISPNLPAFGRTGVTVTSDPTLVAGALSGRDVAIYRDHQNAPASHHILITNEETYSYLIVRRDRRKGLPLFATALYAGGDTSLLRRNWCQVGSHLLSQHGIPATLAERRTLGFTPRLGIDQASPRPKMYRSTHVAPDDIDYLYSELALLDW